MANVLTNQDVYEIMTEIVEQATGQKNYAVVDTSTFTSVGETLLRTSTEPTMHAISQVLIKTVFSDRVYEPKLKSLRVENDRWGMYSRKLVTLWSGYEESNNDNTDINPDQFDDGKTMDHYIIKKPKVLQLNFASVLQLQKHITLYRDQMHTAFSSEGQFLRFLDSYMIEYGNEVSLANENRTRLTMLNYMAGLSALGRVIDLVALYNTRNGTTLTREELLREPNIESFMKFFAATIKKISKKITDYTTMWHTNLTGYNPILRQTPMSKARMIMYDPLFIDSESMVYPTLYNPQYLNIGTFETVNYWQNPEEANSMSINVTPNIINVATGESQTGATQNLPYVVGFLFDEDALGVNIRYEYTINTPINARGAFTNHFTHWNFGSKCDYTENGVLFVLGNGGAP